MSFSGEDTLLTIAQSAVWIEALIGSYSTAKETLYVVPVSNRLTDLEERQKLFEDAGRLRSMAAR